MPVDMISYIGTEVLSEKLASALKRHVEKHAAMHDIDPGAQLVIRVFEYRSLGWRKYYAVHAEVHSDKVLFGDGLGRNLEKAATDALEQIHNQLQQQTVFTSEKPQHPINGIP